MKFKSVLFAAAVACATAFAVSCSEKPSDDPKEPEFVFNALNLTGMSFQMMDRNVGAKSLTDVGNYYQYGNNTPVATADGILDAFDAAWTLDKAADWSVPANTPCPEGWRLPNAEDIAALKKVLDNNEMMYDYDMCTAEELAACEKLVDEMMILACGTYRPDKEGIYLPDASYFWTAVCDKTAGTATLYEDNNFPLFSAKAVPSTAAPLRCVK